MRLTLCVAAIAVVLMVAGCGSDSDSSTSAASRSATTGPTRTTAVLHYVNEYPKPRNPGPHPGARVDQLIVRDVRAGRGPAIQAGDSGTFEFIATNWVTGRPLDQSWGRRRPFETQIDHGVVIDGWWQGIPGMRVGGRRQITVPPSLGFTNSLVRDVRGATTYFDVVLIAIRPQQPRGLAGDQTGAAATG